MLHLSTTKQGTDLGTLVVPFNQTSHLLHLLWTSLKKTWIEPPCLMDLSSDLYFRQNWNMFLLNLGKLGSSSFQIWLGKKMNNQKL